MSATNSDVVTAELVWSLFRRRAAWPSRHEVVVELEKVGLRIASAWRVLEGVASSPLEYASAKEPIRLRLDGLVVVQEAAALLRPLGSVASALAAARVANPPTAADDRGLVGWDDFRHLWPNNADWQLITQLFEDRLLGMPFSRASSVNGRSFMRPSVDCLRFEDVSSFEEVQQIQRAGRGRQEVGEYPSGKHLEFLRRVFHHVVRHGGWPRAPLFAAVERSLGYVPHLQNDLCDAGFVKWEFRDSFDSFIELAPKAVFFIDDSGDGRATLLRVLAECRRQWLDSADVRVSASSLAASVGVPATALAAWLMMLSPPDWATTSRVNDEIHLDVTEAVLRYSDVKDWQHYLLLCERRAHYDEELLYERDSENAGLAIKTAEAASRLRLLMQNNRLDAEVRGRLDELQVLCRERTWRAAVILIGSLAEAILLDVLQRNRAVAERGRRALEKNGLGALMEIAQAHGLIAEFTVHLANEMKGFRDYVHPHRAATAHWRPTQEAVEACWLAFNKLLADIEESRRAGRLTKFELHIPAP